MRCAENQEVSRRYFPAATVRMLQPAACAALLLLVTTVFFSDVLFGSAGKVLSQAGADLSREYIYSRDFGFSQLKQGNLALWNPHIYCGLPFFADFQSALLYPLNLVYLLFPLVQAINLGIAVHVFIAGCCMCLWARFLGLHPLACLVTGFMYMFCGACFPHVYAGHLSNLCSMAWAPLVMLSVDMLAARRSRIWVFLGMLAVSLQILGGHPQYVFYTAVAAVLYSGLLALHQRRIRFMPGIAGMYVGAAALTAAQILPGMQAGAESVRGGGVTYAFAALFSFPPENLLTLLVPGLFGDMTTVTYWGRCLLWEMTAFIGLSGLAVALYGFFYAGRELRTRCAVMICILVVLALGAHTPLFRLLYDFVPGFDMFRGNSKFIFCASLFLIMLAGAGLDRLIAGGATNCIALCCLACAAVFAAAAFGVQHAVSAGAADGLWAKVLLAVHNTGETYISPGAYRDPAFIQQTGRFAAKQLLCSAGVCVALAALLRLMQRTKRAVWLLAFFMIAEVVLFARGFYAVFDPATARGAGTEYVFERDSQDVRVLDLSRPNSVMAVGGKSIWGLGPGVLGRYARLITHSQGGDPDRANQYVDFSVLPRIYKMLRCRYVISNASKDVTIRRFEGVMPRASLLYRYQVITDRDGIFKTLRDASFDPAKTVVLESEPDPAPAGPGAGGAVTVKDLSTDEMIIEARTSSPALLLITDAYSTGWHARPLAGSVQQRYTVMPANYALRAIPLAAGRHRLLLEYRPAAFVAGCWISAVSVVLYIAALLWYLRSRRSFSTCKRGCPDERFASTNN